MAGPRRERPRDHRHPRLVEGRRGPVAAVASLAAARARMRAGRPARLARRRGQRRRASEAGSARAWPEATVLVNAANRGFGPAANQAAAAARGDVLLFLNPDTRAEGDPFSPIARALRRRRARRRGRAAAAGDGRRVPPAGPLRLAPPGREDQATFQLRRLPTLVSDARELLLIDHLVAEQRGAAPLPVRRRGPRRRVSRGAGRGGRAGRAPECLRRVRRASTSATSRPGTKTSTSARGWRPRGRSSSCALLRGRRAMLDDRSKAVAPRGFDDQVRGFPGDEVRAEANGAFRQTDLTFRHFPLAHACVDQDVGSERLAPARRNRARTPRSSWATHGRSAPRVGRRALRSPRRAWLRHRRSRPSRPSCGASMLAAQRRGSRRHSLHGAGRGRPRNRCRRSRGPGRSAPARVWRGRCPGLPSQWPIEVPSRAARERPRIR